MIYRACLGLLFAGASISAAAEPTRLTFEADVLPILNAHCLQCHGGVQQKNGLDLRTLPALLRGGQSGTAVVAGKADASLLWKKISADEMPKTDNKVSEANKKKIREWIETGAHGANRKIDLNLARTPMVPAEVAKHIDEEIAKKLAASKIPASPRSSDSEFLRRVYFDITGKPPSAARTNALLRDSDAHKRSKLIDALLSSDDYGQHCAERWLNLFRQMSVNQNEWEPQRFQAWLAERLKQAFRLSKSPWTVGMTTAGRFETYNGVPCISIRRSRFSLTTSNSAGCSRARSSFS